jgi:hypothetical protein
LNGTLQRLCHVDGVSVLSRSILLRKTQAVATMETGLEVHNDKTKYVAMSGDQNAGQSHYIWNENKSFEKVEKFKYLERTLMNKNFIQKEIKIRMLPGNACYHSVQFFLSSSLVSKNRR